MSARLFRFPRVPGRCLAALAAAFALALPLPAAARTADGSLYGSYLAGRFAANMRDDEAAARFYRNALRRDADNEVILERAFLLDLATGDIESAAALATRLVKIETRHSAARLVLGVKALRARQYASARRHFEAGAGAGPVADITRALTTAWTLQGAGDLKGATEALDVLPEAGWYRIYRDYNAATIADLSGNAKMAGERFAAAYRLDSESLRISESYARFLARRGDTAGAREILDSYDKVSPGHPYIVALRADLDAGRVPKPAVASPAAGAAEGLHQIGALLAREGGEEQAIAYFRLALYLDPAATLPLLSLADIYERRKNHALATAVYERVSADSPMRPYAVMQRARNLDAMDKADEARTLLDELIARQPDNVEAIKTLGDLLRSREKFAEAAEVYTRAVNLLGTVGEQHWTLLYYRGIAYERAKRWPPAEADFKAALALVPDQPYVLNYLGYSWIDQGVNLHEAMEMIRRAVELRPDDGYIVDSLGWAHYRLGEFEQAVEELERAIELKPEDPIINDHLGDAYWRVGRRLEARFQWAHALVFDPEPEERVRIEEKMKDGLSDLPEPKLVVARNEAAASDAGDEAAAADRTGDAPQPDAVAEDAAPAAETADEDAAPAEPLPDEAAGTGEGPAAEVRIHVVRGGDTLWLISRKYFGAGADYPRLFEANRDTLRDADRIYPGQKLIIPAE